jgi:hypothetical protein
MQCYKDVPEKRTLCYRVRKAHTAGKQGEPEIMGWVGVEMSGSPCSIKKILLCINYDTGITELLQKYEEFNIAGHFRHLYVYYYLTV